MERCELKLASGIAFSYCCLFQFPRLCCNQQRSIIIQTKQMAIMYFNRCRRGKDSGPNDPNLGNNHHVLDRLCANDHLLSGSGNHHEPPPRPFLQNPSRIPHCLFCQFYSPYCSNLWSNCCPSISPLHRQPTWPNPTPTDRSRPCDVQSCHDRSCSDWDQAAKGCQIKSSLS